MCLIADFYLIMMCSHMQHEETHVLYSEGRVSTVSILAIILAALAMHGLAPAKTDTDVQAVQLSSIPKNTH